MKFQVFLFFAFIALFCSSAKVMRSKHLSSCKALGDDCDANWFTRKS